MSGARTPRFFGRAALRHMVAKTSPEPTKSVVRTMLSEDAPCASEILRESPETVFWAEAGVTEVLAWPGVLGLVIESSAGLTAFLLARQAADEAEILNLVVEKGSRRKGQGATLLRSAEDELAARGVKRLFLEVRESNETAIAFYRKHGFTRTGRRPAYYRNPQEAALILEKRLST